MKRIIKFKNRTPYCENPAIGVGAPECSENCYKFGACNKDAYFRYIYKNHRIIPTDTTYPHAVGLYTCHICGAKVETAYFDGDNGPAICEECKDKKEANKLTEICNINIEGKNYPIKEIIKIVKKHEEEEDKKYSKCFRCNNKYLENKLFNMVDENLNEDVELEYGQVIGYQIPPIITGVEIMSTCGKGKKIGLCDDCIGELINWFNPNTHINQK